ncbi:MAG: helix-turn-helix transcriptional regulator [Clostridia bacterium]|nr:helix-turn-helix transcriptional regulator [Clostridia bacterium]
MKTFGENLKNLRTASKLSQKEFAEKLNTTQQRVSEWECNKIEPSLYNIIKILKIFDITFEELIDGVDF